MTPKEYQALARRTVCPQPLAWDRINRLHKEAVPFLHAVIGIQGEAGELAAAVEKWLWYGQALDRVNVKEETGDLLWYIALLCNTLGFDLGEVMEANIAKLRKRFPEKYTDEKALEENRDRAAERDEIDKQTMLDTKWAQSKMLHVPKDVKIRQLTPEEACKLGELDISQCTHEFDSSLTCNYCGGRAEEISKKTGGPADYAICKERMKAMAGFTKLQQTGPAIACKVTDPDITITISGNRGQGKTTVAILIAQMLNSLKQFDVEYVGPTDAQTRRIVNIIDDESRDPTARVYERRTVQIVDRVGGPENA